MCLVSASILHDLSDMQPQINAIKIEHPPYYCSSYTPPSAATAADHAQPTANFSKFEKLRFKFTFPNCAYIIYGIAVSADAHTRARMDDADTPLVCVILPPLII